MKELAYETTDKQKKGFLSVLHVSLNFNRLRDFKNGSECDTGSENVIILAIHFCIR